MTLPTAKGPAALSEETFARCLIASPEFVKFTKEADPADVPNHIHFNVISKDPESEVFDTAQLIAQRPLACLWVDPEAGLTLRRGGTGRVVSSGIIHVLFEKEVQDALDEDPNIDAEIEGEVFRYWVNMIGTIARESFNDEIMHVNELTNFRTWQVPPDEKNAGLGDFFGAYFKVSWGVA